MGYLAINLSNEMTKNTHFLAQMALFPENDPGRSRSFICYFYRLYIYKAICLCLCNMPKKLQTS